VKIKGTCKRDGREILAELVVGTGGNCPWDGEPFSPDYAVTLVDALRDAEVAGTHLERALETVADLHPALTLDDESVLGDIRTHLARLRQNLVQQG
jgi:predicted GTPase